MSATDGVTGARPRLGVWKFASCDGCQLTLLDCEDELLAVAGAVDIAYFLEAGRSTVDGPFDLSLVEGSVTTPADAERIREVRAASRHLVTIGACATAGGVQALRNFADVEEYLSIVYAQPEFISTLGTSTPIADHVPVDFELRGCPIDKGQLVEVLAAFLNDRRPEVPGHSVCVECKLRGNVCVMVAHGTPCLGPVTHAGCGALCPTYHRGCYGCFGPMETPNTAALADELARDGVGATDLVRLLRTFNTWSPAFRDESSARMRQAPPAGPVPVSLSRERRRPPPGGGTVTHKVPAGRTLRVEALARVEGEGAMHVETRDGEVVDVQLRIYEPPRFFEAFLRGRAHTEPPDLTARICGICPVAYQMSACRAIEDACGVTVDGPLEQLRRLIYCGEWIESHALHVYLLHAPDFLGVDNAIELAGVDKPAVERGLRLKKTGNDLIELIGGRAIHPVNVRVGGFYRVPTRRELRTLVGPLERARDDALATVAWVSAFDFPDLEHDHTYVALREPGDEYPVLQGRIVSSGGLDAAEAEFLDHVVETHVAHSTALHAHLGRDENYLVGPLARYSLSGDRLTPLARAAARDAGLGEQVRNPYRSIVVRAVEVVHACDRALALIDAYDEPDRPAVAVEPRAGVGHGCTEAPRGLLYHRYELDGSGTIVDARIVPPTSQNQPTIEHDLWHVVERNLDLDDAALTRRCEQTIRNYDPCISCAAHFLDLTRTDR